MPFLRLSCYLAREDEAEGIWLHSVSNRQQKPNQIKATNQLTDQQTKKKAISTDLSVMVVVEYACNSSPQEAETVRQPARTSLTHQKEIENSV